MKVIINNAEMVPTPKKGTIIRFGDLKGSLADYVYLYVGYNPPTMNDGKWEESDDDGIFWSEEDFNDSLNKLFGTVAFPELNKGECMEIELVCELKMK